MGEDREGPDEPARRDGAPRESVEPPTNPVVFAARLCTPSVLARLPVPWQRRCFAYYKNAVLVKIVRAWATQRGKQGMWTGAIELSTTVARRGRC